ncbi:MAG: ribonuclease HII [Planktomarina sp.]
MTPDLSIEQNYIDKGFPCIVGVDEVGRGPLAGPVCAAAVVFFDTPPDGLNDSKLLSAKRRAQALPMIEAAAHVGVGWASPAEIDEINILQASHLAMIRAVEALPVKPDFALIDGNRLPKDLTIPAQAIVKGDQKSVSIAAASIVAKIRRDLVMEDLAQQFPGYGWEKNSGYPTKAHIQALQDLGVTPHHRQSFKPVHNMLYQGKM